MYQYLYEKYKIKKSGTGRQIFKGQEINYTTLFVSADAFIIVELLTSML
jgi:hypothetical protein